MNDQTPAFPAQTSAAPRSRTPRGGLTKYAVILALGLGVIGVGAFATSSFSQGPDFIPAFGHGFGHGPGFWRGGRFGGAGPFDPARAEERADRMIRHLAVEVDATADQQEKLRGIAKNAVKDMLPMREKLVAARQQARGLLLGQTVDRAAVEKLRSEQIGVADALSKRLTQALTDAADVLTPEQRRKLEDLLPPAGSGRRGWSRG
jgi:Spy/CpxP family protein refolding chaperone